MLHHTNRSTLSLSSSSTLTETVSIDCEDFTDNFLKCSTCLCLYETIEHNPKLLPCSHTVCHACLERIVAAQGSECRTFRCPICRETVTVPRGGVLAFPPSFIINQLLDLMARQRREVVPKCSTHLQSELMFCETCDEVFCFECTSGGGIHSNKDASGHTVVSFSVAIKRMSEILLYKTGLCIKNLDKASSVVIGEMNRLDVAADRCLDMASLAFQDIASLVEQRRQEIAQTVCYIREEKKRLLREQLAIIEAEKSKVRSSCEGIHSQVEVRSITSKISDLNDKLDISTTLIEPRENAFMLFEPGVADLLAGGGSELSAERLTRSARSSPPLALHNSVVNLTGTQRTAVTSLSMETSGYPSAFILGTLPGSDRSHFRDSGFVGLQSDAGFASEQYAGHLIGRDPAGNGAEATQARMACTMMSTIARALGRFGCIRVSKTFPALCTLDLVPVVVHLKAVATVRTVDYHGVSQTTGGDPVYVEMINERRELIPTNVTDNHDGTYSVSLTPRTAGKHILNITIFDRCIRDSPFVIDVVAHINPTKKLGGSGSGELEFRQPVGVLSASGLLYVLDTGNSRIQVLDVEGRFVRHIHGSCMNQHSGTGFCLTGSGNLIVVNWRTKRVTEICSRTGDVVRDFTCSEFVEPICVAVNRHGEIVVGDNGVGKLFVFDSAGRKLRVIGRRGDEPGQLKLISFVCAAPNDEILVCDHRIQAFSRTGAFLYEFPTRTGFLGKQFGAVTVDRHGNYLVSRSEKGRSVIEVYNSSRGLLFDIDSASDKLKRPSGLAATADGHVYVADLGNDCVKKYRYL